MDKKYLSRASFETNISILEATLKALIEEKALKNVNLVPICRGGMVPATVLSNRTGIPIKDVVNVKSYVEGSKVKNMSQIYKSLRDNSPTLSGTPILIEDIIDTGDTLDALLNNYIADHPDILCLSIVGVEKTLLRLRNIYQDTVIQSSIRLNQPSWVIFPWE